MALEKLTLRSLEDTAVKQQFEEAIEVIRQSLGKDGDVDGARSLTMKMSFTPDERGYIATDISVVASTPHRKLKTLAIYEEGVLKIDAVTNDARQPSLLEGAEGGKVTQLRKEGR